MKKAVLIVREHEGSTWTHKIAEAETLIGRGAASDVRVGDKAISRDHAATSWEGGRYVLEDLQTTNGTRRNGRRVRNGPLEDGDQIQVGKTLITCKYE